MAGEEVACPRCGQRVLTPAHDRPPEKALPAAGPPPVPRRSIFPDFPVLLDPPEGGVRVGVPVRGPRPDELPAMRRPLTAWVVGLLLVVGGVWAFVHVITFTTMSGGLCCLWPPMFLELPWGVAAVVRGVMILFALRRPRAPTVVVIEQVYLCGCFDLVNTVLGIIIALLLCSPKARRYFRNEWGE